MEHSFGEIRKLAARDDESRRSTITALRDLANSLETTNDTIHRYGHMNLQTATVKIGIDLGLFKLLSQSSSPLSVEELSQRLSNDPTLTKRIVRFLASIGAIHEVDTNKFTANHVTKNLSESLAEAGLSHYFGTASPMYQTLPAFLKKTCYKDPVDELHTSFQDAFHTELPVFAWFASHPQHLGAFNEYMRLRRQPTVSWLTAYPVLDQVKNWDSEKAIFVNVGGGVGHQCAEFKQRFPDLPGKVILQDLPHSIAAALSTPGVENMVHDFFEPQPVRGAKFYHIRGVLHNHPPHKVRTLLENIKSAMTEESVLLIDEMIFPESRVHYDAASIDMTMLTAFASMERTEVQWHQTLAEVGLQLVKTYTYNPLSYETVMDVRLPRSS